MFILQHTWKCYCEKILLLYSMDWKAKLLLQMHWKVCIFEKSWKGSHYFSSFIENMSLFYNVHWQILLFYSMYWNMIINLQQELEPFVNLQHIMKIYCYFKPCFDKFLLFYDKNWKVWTCLITRSCVISNIVTSWYL